MHDFFSVSRWRDQLNRLAGHGVYPHEFAFLLDFPLRKLILSPQKLAGHLHLTSHAHVLEIGNLFHNTQFFIEIAKIIRLENKWTMSEGYFSM